MMDDSRILNQMSPFEITNYAHAKMCKSVHATWEHPVNSDPLVSDQI